MYDPETNEWSDGVSLPKPMTGFSLKMHRDGSVILFGGEADAQYANFTNNDFWNNYGFRNSFNHAIR